MTQSIKTSLRLLLLFLFVTSCSKQEIRDINKMETNKAFSNMSIGEAHNYLLSKAYEKFGDELRSTNTRPLHIMAVIDYWYSLDEVKAKDSSHNSKTEVKVKFTELLELCKQNHVQTSQEFKDCLDTLLMRDGGISIADLQNPKSSLRATKHQQILFNDVLKHSSLFWSERYKVDLRASNNAIIISDAAGALWGGFFSFGAASVIAGAAASLVAENIGGGGYDWRANPKYI